MLASYIPSYLKSQPRKQVGSCEMALGDTAPHPSEGTVLDKMISQWFPGPKPMFDLLSQIARVKRLIWPLPGLVVFSVKRLYASLMAVFRDCRDVMDMMCKTGIAENMLDSRKKVIERRGLACVYCVCKWGC